MNEKRVLFYDSSHLGHHFEFLDYLIRFSKKDYVDKVIFYGHPKLIEKGAANGWDKLGVLMFSIPDKTISKGANLKNEELVFIQEKITQLNVNHLFLMNLDPFLKPLIDNKGEINFKISGILFRPFFRMAYPSFFTKSFFKRQKIKIVQNNFAKLSFVDKVFILNDSAAVQHLNKKNQKFEYLPDPINNDFEKNTDFSLKKHYAIPSNRKVLLVFGSIHPRKNIVNILKALHHLTIDEAAETSLVILGKCQDGFLSLVKQEINSLKEKQKQLQIVFNNEFLLEDYIANIFEESDLVLIPYLKFYYSSGLLGHAIRAKKPVVVSHYGLMYDLVQKYNLGVSVDPENPKSIFEGIQKALLNERDDESMKAFIENHTPEAYAKTIFQIVGN